MKQSLIFMGTPQFAVPTLRALVNAGHIIAAVYTAPPKPAGRGQKETLTPVHRAALEYHLPVFTPASLKDSQSQQFFRNLHADAAVVAAYGLLLPPAILEGTKLGCLNVHPSLLPRWRGAAPIQRAIMAGDKETGIVIMQMNAGLDTGDMLLTERYHIADGTTAGQLHDALAQKAGAMMVQTLEGLAAGSITATPQPEEGVTYAKKITKEECRIHWNQPASAIRNHILGLSPHPGAFFVYQGEHIKILDAALTSTAPSANAPGTVLDHQLTIACVEGALTPKVVQRPGKKAMATHEMLQGYSIPAGSTVE